MDRDKGYLVDMLLAANRILERTRGRSRDDLDHDISLQETVYWQTCVLGEAAGHLSDEFCMAHADEPWLRMAGLRNRIIHGYGEIDHDILWDVVVNHLPRLAALLAGAASEEDRGDAD